MALKKKEEKEFKEKILEIKRVTRVVAGGKRFSFRATLVVGNLKGKVGIGIAKGLDPAIAVEKARKQALKNVISVYLKDNRTVPYEVEAKYSAAKVRIKPAKEGHGLRAGGGMRVVLELAGFKDISAKQLGRTTNRLTNAMAALNALKKIKLEDFAFNEKEKVVEEND